MLVFSTIVKIRICSIHRVLQIEVIVINAVAILGLSTGNQFEHYIPSHNVMGVVITQQHKMRWSLISSHCCVRRDFDLFLSNP